MEIPFAMPSGDVKTRHYGFTLLTFAVVDTLWLGIVARRFYASQLGGLLRPDVNLSAASLFYLAYAAGIVFFVVLESIRLGLAEMFRSISGCAS